MIEKIFLVVALLLVALLLMMTTSRATIAKAVILLLPFSIQSRFGQLNTYLLIGICGFYLTHDLLTGDQRPTFRPATKALLFAILGAYLASFLANLGHLDFRLGVLQSPHTQEMLIIISCILLFYFLVEVTKRKDNINDMILFMMLAYLLSSTFCIIQLMAPSLMVHLEAFIPYQDIADSLDRGVRVYGTLGSYELYAEYSGFSFLIAVYLAMSSSNMLHRLLWISTACVALTLLMLTKTRGPILAFLIIILYLIIFEGKALGRKRAMTLLAGLFFGFGCAYVALIGSRYNVLEALIKRTDVNVSAGRFDTRTEVWTYARDLFLSFDIQSFTFGLGPGLVSQTALLRYYPHSLYLYLALSLGLLGLFLYLTLFYWIAFARHGASEHCRGRTFLSSILKAAILFILIDEIKIEYLRASSYQQIIWALLALTYCSRSQAPASSKYPEETSRGQIQGPPLANSTRGTLAPIGSL